MRRLQVDPRALAAAEQAEAFADGPGSEASSPSPPSWAVPIDAEVRAVQEAMELGAGAALRIFWRSAQAVDAPVLCFVRHLVEQYPHLLAQQPRTAQAVLALMTTWVAAPGRLEVAVAEAVGRALCQLVSQVVAPRVANASLGRLPPALDVAPHAFHFLVMVAKARHCGGQVGSALLALARAACAGGHLARPPPAAVLEEATPDLALRAAQELAMPGGVMGPAGASRPVRACAAGVETPATFQEAMAAFLQGLTRLDLDRQLAAIEQTRQAGQARAYSVMVHGELPEQCRRLAQLTNNASEQEMVAAAATMQLAARLLQLSVPDDAIERELLTEDVVAGMTTALQCGVDCMDTHSSKQFTVTQLQQVMAGAAAALEYFRAVLERSGDKAFQQLARQYHVMQAVTRWAALDTSMGAPLPPFLAALARRCGDLPGAVGWLCELVRLEAIRVPTSLSPSSREVYGLLAICTKWVRAAQTPSVVVATHATLFKVMVMVVDRRWATMSWADVYSAVVMLLHELAFGSSLKSAFGAKEESAGEVEDSVGRARQVLSGGFLTLLLDAVERTFLAQPGVFSGQALAGVLAEALALNSEAGIDMTGGVLLAMEGRLKVKSRPESEALLAALSSYDVQKVIFDQLRAPEVKTATVHLLVRFWALVIKGHQDRDTLVRPRQTALEAARLAPCLKRESRQLLAEVVEKHGLRALDDVKFIQRAPLN